MLDNANILVIEDDPNSATLVYDLLTAMGAHVVCVNNGVDGIKKLNGSDFFHLVILDLRLPGQNGFVVAEHIRSLERKIPIIVTSAFTDAANKLRAYEVGVNYIVGKPIDTMELYYIVHNMLQLLSK